MNTSIQGMYMAVCAEAAAAAAAAAKPHHVYVRALVLGAVGRVAKCFDAALELALVGALASVRAQVDLQVLLPRERLVAALELQHQQQVRTSTTTAGAQSTQCNRAHPQKRAENLYN